MSPSRLTAAISLLAAASAAGYWFLSHSGEVSGTEADPEPSFRQPVSRKTPEAATVGMAAAGNPSATDSPSGNATPATLRSPGTRLPSSVRTQPPTDPRSGWRQGATPQGPDSTRNLSNLSRAELQARAARVEQEANHDLRRLVSLLDLSPQQQDQIFQTLASRSPLWVPGMTTANPDGSNPGNPTSTPPADSSKPTADSPATSPTASTPAPEESDPLASILPYLTPEQQEALVADEMDRAAWWEEIIPILLPEDAIPPVTTSPEIKEFSGPDSLD